VKVVNIDVTQDMEVSEKFNLLTFPTIKLFIQGARVPIHYTGNKIASELVEWVKIKTGDMISKEIHTQEQLEDIAVNSPLVAVFIGSQESKAYDEYIEAIRHYNHIVSVNTNNEEIKRKYDVDMGVLVLKEYGKEILVSKNEVDFEGVRRFMNGQIYSSVSPFNSEVRHRIFEDGQDVLILLTSENVTNSIEDTFREVAEELREKVGFSVAKVGTNLEVKMFDVIRMSIPQIFDASNEELPMIGIIKVQERMKKYYMDGEITRENIKKFVENYLEKKVRPYIQSEPIPEEKYDEDMRVLVGKTFSEVVYDNEKNVLVSFCSAKKNNCQMTDVAKIVARRLKDRKDLVVAKMDPLLNNVEVMEKFHSPALVLFPKGNKEKFIVYRGYLNDIAVMKFIDDNTFQLADENQEVGLNKEMNLNSDL